MLNLCYREDDKSRLFPLRRDSVVIGREESCDLVVKDFTVSRRHAHIIFTDGKFIIEDLQSRNGVKVNSLKVSRAPLKDGDVVILGNSRFSVRESLKDSEVTMADGVMKSEGTIVRSLKDLEGYLTGDKGQKPEGAGFRKLEEENRLLMVLTQVARALISLEPLEKTLDRVMDLVLKHISAERGFLMLKDGDTGELVPYVIKHKDDDENQEICISRTIADKVLNEKVAILSTDVQTDPRFKDGESIKIMGIHSAMCVPLWLKDRVIGIIHLDTPIAGNAFNERDLDLLSALANYAAVAIERSKLNEQFEKEKEMKKRLERYHSPAVADQIMNSGGGVTGGYNLRATELEASVVFADIVSFTALSDDMTPNEISLLLNEYFSTMTDAVFKYQGTLDKYIGDSVMAVFGAPIRQDNHCVNAVMAAFEMMECIKEINDRRTDGLNIRLHIGINSGNVVAGDIGSLKRVDYTVLGNTVNVASRLQEEAAPDRILTGRKTYEAVRDIIETEYLGERKLRGIKNKIPVYLLKGMKESGRKQQ